MEIFIKYDPYLKTQSRTRETYAEKEHFDMNNEINITFNVKKMKQRLRRKAADLWALSKGTNTAKWNVWPDGWRQRFSKI